MLRPGLVQRRDPFILLPPRHPADLQNRDRFRAPLPTPTLGDLHPVDSLPQHLIAFHLQTYNYPTAKIRPPSAFIPAPSAFIPAPKHPNPGALDPFPNSRHKKNSDHIRQNHHNLFKLPRPNRPIHQKRNRHSHPRNLQPQCPINLPHHHKHDPNRATPNQRHCLRHCHRPHYTKKRGGSNKPIGIRGSDHPELF